MGLCRQRTSAGCDSCARAPECQIPDGVHARRLCVLLSLLKGQHVQHVRVVVLEPVILFPHNEQLVWH